MAEVGRMTVDEVVSYFLEGEGVDYLRESLTWVCQQLMEAEVSELRRRRSRRAGTRGAPHAPKRVSPAAVADARG